MNAKNVSRLLVALTVAAIVICSWYPPIQSLADEQVDAGLKRALISFASARALNGVISVIQGTEFSMQPMGIGITLTVGQVLDPVNDLVEQFSSLMLVASVAFGIQKALLAIGAHWMISLLVSAIAVAWGVLRLMKKSPPWLSRLMLVLVMVRFAFPVVTLGSDQIFQSLLARDYGESQAALDVAASEVGKSTPKLAAVSEAEEAAQQQPDPAKRKGWWDRLTQREADETQPDEASGRRKGFLETIKGILPKPDFAAIQKSLRHLPERVIKLIVVFVMQTIILPIILLWALYRVALGVIRPERPIT